MTTLAQLYKNAAREYAETHNNEPATAREIAEWGTSRGLLQPRPVDPIARLAKEISDALSEERGAEGERVNLARRVTINGQTTMLWGRVDAQPRAFVEGAVQDWRKQIAGECVVVAKTLQHRRRTHPDEEEIQFSFNFGADVEEALPADDDENVAA